MAIRQVGKFFAQHGSGWQTILSSNQSIQQSIRSAVQQGGLRAGMGSVGGINVGGAFSGIPRAIENIRHGGKNLDVWNAVKAAHTTADGAVSYGSIAGSYLTAATGYRLLSGGGAYKDRHGRTNLIGLPFV